MVVNRVELAVLQAIVDHLSALGQAVRRDKVLEELRRKDIFSGEDGEERFSLTVAKLSDECLIEMRTHKEAPYLTITTDALKVEGLMIDCLIL